MKRAMRRAAACHPGQPYLSLSAASSSRACFVARFSTSSFGIPVRPLLRSVSNPPTNAPTTRTMMMMALSNGISSTYAVTRIKPSCDALATSRPSRANTLPRVKPRAPEALGLSMAYNSQSSTRTLR